MKSIELVGHHIFGRALRLRLALWILGLGKEQQVSHVGEPAFHQTDAARALGRQACEVSDDLERFIELGMLEKLPRERGNAPQYYRRRASPLWDVFRPLVNAGDVMRGEKSA